jgi:hypothetical protein
VTSRYRVELVLFTRVEKISKFVFGGAFERPAVGFADSFDSVLKRVATVAPEPECEDVIGSAQPR